ncbi:MAG: phage tail protein I [Clostridiales bacterium]|jgi:phage tail P2-like protein|nr:phage tail protein I [Clostridiales bacterium]
MINLDQVSILNILPPNIAGDRNVKLAAEAFDLTLREMIAEIPNLSILPRIGELTDSLLLDLLAWQFHVDFYNPQMSVEVKRVLVQRSLDRHFRKGTPAVVEEIVKATIGDATVKEWFEYGGEPGFFRVETEEAIEDDETFNNLIAAIFSVKNTRSWLEFVIILVRGTLNLYQGIGVWFDDIVFIGLPGEDTAVTIADPVTPYVGVFADIFYELIIPAGEEQWNNSGHQS